MHPRTGAKWQINYKVTLNYKALKVIVNYFMELRFFSRFAELTEFAMLASAYATAFALENE